MWGQRRQTLRAVWWGQRRQTLQAVWSGQPPTLCLCAVWMGTAVSSTALGPWTHQVWLYVQPSHRTCAYTPHPIPVSSPFHDTRSESGVGMLRRRRKRPFWGMRPQSAKQFMVSSEEDEPSCTERKGSSREQTGRTKGRPVEWTN